MTTRRSGNDFQLRVKKILEGLGYVVHNFPMSAVPVRILGGAVKVKKGRPVFSRKSNDVFGSDLVARRDNPLPEKRCVRWIQATRHSGIKKRLEEFQKYWTFTLPGESVELWQGKKDGTIRVLEYLPGLPELQLRGRVVKGKFESSTPTGTEEKAGEK